MTILIFSFINTIDLIVVSRILYIIFTHNLDTTTCTTFPQVICRDIIDALINITKGAPRLIHSESFKSLQGISDFNGIDVTSIIISTRQLAKHRYPTNVR